MCSLSLSPSQSASFRVSSIDRSGHTAVDDRDEENCTRKFVFTIILFGLSPSIVFSALSPVVVSLRRVRLAVLYGHVYGLHQLVDHAHLLGRPSPERVQLG